jgi:hypothetical protein
LLPATRRQQIHRSFGVILLGGFVSPSSTDARRGSSTRLFSPPATHQPHARKFFFICDMVDLLLLWPKDLPVFQPSL